MNCDHDSPRIVLEGGTNLSSELVAGKALVLGRSRGADFRIPHPSIAPRHCELIWDGAQSIQLRRHADDCTLEVNEQPVTTATALQHGDQISMGLFRIRLEWPADPNQTGSGQSTSASNPFNAGTAAKTSHTLATGPQPSANANPQTGPVVLYHGEFVREIPLRDNLVIGTGDDADIQLQGERISRRHALISRAETGFEVIDVGEAGSLVNGKYFERHSLTIGDFLNIGDYWFTFDGHSLSCLANPLGCSLIAIDLTVRGDRGHTILEDASFRARPGQFVGILGPSGAGKTTLLRTLSGQVARHSGQVLINQIPLNQIDDPSDYLGFVPQQEIVHLELTARDALTFSALLRLPKRTPSREIHKLIDQLTARLGIQQHLDTRASRLSGGQLKRLSVCVELLSRPALLFLDEPTSGLDPETERELMQQLQELTFTGCTVVATTHLMDNVHLMHSIEVVMAGTNPETGQHQPGTTIFRGRPRAAKDFFEVTNLTRLFHKLRELPCSEWRQRFLDRETAQTTTEPCSRSAIGSGSATESADKGSGGGPRPIRRRRRHPVPILLRRQAALILADPKNLLLLIGQPLLIAGLIALVAVAEHASATKLFLAYIATLWLGCSNAATEIVREKSIFRREQFVGLSATSYLTAKFIGMGLVTSLQALLIFLVVKLVGNGLDGDPAWQLGGLIACAGASTGMGLAVSALARTSLQAVFMVPVLIIPQILFAGFVFPLKDWNEAPAARMLSRLAPSFAAQRIMDTSLLWNRRIGNYFHMEDAGLHIAYDNLGTSLSPLHTLFAWQPPEPFEFEIDERQLYQPDPEASRPVGLGVRQVKWSVNAPPGYRMGVLFHHSTPAIHAFLLLAAWVALSFAAARWLLRSKAMR